MVAVLTESRLVTVSEEALEVAHEALLREWPRFGMAGGGRGRSPAPRPRDPGREGMGGGGRDPAELYRGARLAAALDWAAEHGLS